MNQTLDKTAAPFGALLRAGRSLLGQGAAASGRAGLATARALAGVPRGQAFAPTFRAGAMNTARALFMPRYPGLDRAPGMATMARPLDRTRAALATGLRATGTAAGLFYPNGHVPLPESP